MTPPIDCDVIPAAVGRCDRGTPGCVANHHPARTCPVQTEIQEHTFRCTLPEGHWPDDHSWWLAAPVNKWLPMPVWTAATLIEDDWETD